jgi:hypothetical protein
VEPEHIDEFEKELQQIFERRPAPPSLKRKVMERRGLQSTERRHHYWVAWQRVAAGLILAAMLGGLMQWQLQRAEDRRRGEEARRQVMTALRVTERALNEMNLRLAAHNRNADQ